MLEKFLGEKLADMFCSKFEEIILYDENFRNYKRISNFLSNAIYGTEENIKNKINFIRRNSSKILGLSVFSAVIFGLGYRISEDLHKPHKVYLEYINNDNYYDLLIEDKLGNEHWFLRNRKGYEKVNNIDFFKKDISELISCAPDKTSVVDLMENKKIGL